MRTLRRWVYTLGIRPKSDSIFYSPSLSYIYGYRDVTKTLKRK